MNDLTVPQAAALLGLKPRSVRKFIERGMIKGEKRGRDWFITQNEIDRYNRERRKPGAQKGHNRTDETKRKLSDARKGTKNPFYGKKHTPQSLAKMSVAQSQQPRGDQSHAWKGGRVIDKKGYVWRFMPKHPNAVDRYVAEHRLVMEAILGRYLNPSEDVHHINGNKADNRPENLQVMTRSEHIKHHRDINPTLPSIRKKRGL